MEQELPKNEKKATARDYLILQGAVFIYSLNTVCAKFASAETPLSLPFLGWLFAEVALLGVYALIWQQVIKKIDLSVGYANKAVGLVWALLWSVLLFRDGVTVKKIAALALVIAGTVLMNTERGKGGGT